MNNMNNILVSNEEILDLVNAIYWLTDECDINLYYTFAVNSEGSEFKALENLKNKVKKLEKTLHLTDQD